MKTPIIHRRPLEAVLESGPFSASASGHPALSSLNHFDIYESVKEIHRASMVISGSGNTGLR